ncbi:BZ3500_MvSof-1268-A1-R1_Chr6-2g08430 [Microbotryum saponariae]|uniref:BZ3500_MvSof-1268-A1-R1_Chr6-2g08430 protein n=1 Tax=Microbotryum saponariae TaxID=289078 RepID=A0A2X0NPH4_9BASI|nr:BZ3500_MvSof-1268-A1-R1_Chr6-2g08430 [Microbotryum saponariae]SDA07707.1 BZ3501_MvSof-1269-A2-R1_Chr6-1g08144 [Microbotryum saponariae]
MMLEGNKRELKYFENLTYIFVANPFLLCHRDTAPIFAEALLRFGTVTRGIWDFKLEYQNDALRIFSTALATAGSDLHKLIGRVQRKEVDMLWNRLELPGRGFLTRPPVAVASGHSPPKGTHWPRISAPDVSCTQNLSSPREPDQTACSASGPTNQTIRCTRPIQDSDREFGGALPQEIHAGPTLVLLTAKAL